MEGAATPGSGEPPATTGLRIVFRAPVLFDLPLAGLRATGSVEGGLDITEDRLRDGCLRLGWRSADASADHAETELPLRLPLAGEEPTAFTVELPAGLLPRGAGQVTATLLDAVGDVRALAVHGVAAPPLAELPLRDAVVELPLRGTRLVDLPIVALDKGPAAFAGPAEEDLRIAMRPPTEVPLPRLAEADVAAMHAAGGAAKRFIAPRYPLNGLWVAVLRNASVMGQHGLVVTRGGIAEESWVGDHPKVPRPQQLTPFLREWRAPPLRCGDVGMWWAGPWRKLNYYHTHGEALCGLVQLEMFRDLAGVPDFDILLPNLSGWAKEAVDLLGLDARRIRFIGNDCVQPERLYWASGNIRHNVGIEPLLRLVCRRIRAAALAREEAAQVASPLGEGAEVVYVARTDSPFRPLRNEPELIEALRRRGVRIFVASGLRYAEQVLALSRARVVIGPHGAGLTNIGFAEAGALVVEIHPHHYTTPLYFRFAHVMGHRYRAFTAPPSSDMQDDDPKAWRLDLDAFLGFLDPLLEAEAKR